MFNAIIVAELSPEIHSSIGTYAYTADLCALGSARPPEVYTILPELEGMQSPLTDRRQQWQECLSAHPDKRFVDYILDGIKEGFRVGFDYASPLRSTSRNMQSAVAHPRVIENYIMGEVEEAECSVLLLQVVYQRYI